MQFSSSPRSKKFPAKGSLFSVYRALHVDASVEYLATRGLLVLKKAPKPRPNARFLTLKLSLPGCPAARSTCSLPPLFPPCPRTLARLPNL